MLFIMKVLFINYIRGLIELAIMKGILSNNIKGQLLHVNEMFCLWEWKDFLSKQNERLSEII